jgi:hypothetical protein
MLSLSCPLGLPRQRLAVDPYVVGAKFVMFFPAIVITTLVSGFGAGFFCAVLSTAAADQAIGLALHELTVNAGKYGALSKV